MGKYARYRKAKKTKKSRKPIVFVVIFLVLLLAAVVLLLMNRIKAIEVTGNEHYTKEEIKELIVNGEAEHNALYLYWKYNYGESPEIPFVDTIEVSLTGWGKVSIRIYEKEIIGYVEYLGQYMYFDKDGVVVESSREAIDDIPLVSGLEFNKIVLYEKLEVKREKVFDLLLNLTQLLTKYQIQPDNIWYNENLEATLYFENVKVLLGGDTDMNEKVTRLSYLMSEIEGRSGTLHMENFNEDTRNITFEIEETAQ